jgi:hypothetical protein
MAAVPPVIAAAAVAAPVYARFPGTHNQNNWLDYRNNQDRKLYTAAIEWLEDKYDLSPDKLFGYGQRIKAHATMYGWDLDIPHMVPGAAAAVPTNLIDNYGLVTMAECRAHGTTILGVNDRRNQNDGMLYNYLQASLTTEAHSIIDLEPQQYMINGEVTGVCLLKYIFSKAHVDTNATVGSLRNQLASLDDKMIEVKNDIKLFHQHVLQLEHSLAAHGEHCDELMANLFKAYKKVNDDDFRQFIQIHAFNWGNQTGGGGLTAHTLMTSVDNHYAGRIIDKSWKPRTVKSDKERIIALESTIDIMKKGKNDSPGNNGGNSGNNNNNGSSGKDNKGKYGWKKVPPKPNKPHTIVWRTNGKTYHWCPHHLQWTIHHPNDCTKGNGGDNATANTTEETAMTPTDHPNHPNRPTMTIDPALQAIVDSEGHMFA